MSQVPALLSAPALTHPVNSPKQALLLKAPLKLSRALQTLYTFCAQVVEGCLPFTIPVLTFYRTPLIINIL